MNYLLISVVMLVIVVGASAYEKALKKQASRRALLGLPETPIGAVKDGEKVRIKGRAGARGALQTSPASGRRCVGYRLIVEAHDGGMSGWQKIAEDDAFYALLLSDDTGEAVLHPPFDIQLEPYRETFVNAAPLALASLLVRKGVWSSDVFGTKRPFRYVETILMPGDEIIAVGHATIEIDPAGRSPSPRDPPMMCHLNGLHEPVVLAEAEELAEG